VLKETDLRVNFTQWLWSGTERTLMDKSTLQRRLLLTLFGLGANVGIKSMESKPLDDYNGSSRLHFVQYLEIEGKVWFSVLICSY